MDLLVPAELLGPPSCTLDCVMQLIGEFVSPAAHLVRIGLSPFEFIDVEEVKEGECRDEVFQPGKRRHLDTDGKPHTFCMLRGRDKI